MLTFADRLFDRDRATLMPNRVGRAVMTAYHYLHSYPSGWSRCYLFDGTYVVFSITANAYLESFLFTQPVGLLELSRMWAADGHGPNSLTRALAACIGQLRRDHLGCAALVSYADPNAGHHGGIYQAASWQYVGQSDETRSYQTDDGRTIARRSFHSGSTSIVPTLPMTRAAGKYRYVRCLTTGARRALRLTSVPYLKPRGPA